MSPREPPPPPDRARPRSAPARTERLAAALRANLKRRKAQARGREATDPTAAAEVPAMTAEPVGDPEDP